MNIYNVTVYRKHWIWIVMRYCQQNNMPKFSNTCKYANGCQICESHSPVNQILTQEMTESINKRQEGGTIKWLILEVKRAQKAKGAC